uniref:Alpha-ketoglutarate-dependent dioxygenase AlkB-like domain-containing protein n=1 Tax=Entomoneis paludosa TaxID=265537 RepID=A0A7S2YDV2_9STRA
MESDAVLHFTRRRPAQEILPNNNPPHNSADQPLQVWLEKGSLVIFCQEAYSDWMHSIPTNETSIALDPIQCVNLGSSSDDDATSSSPQMVHRGDRRISLTFRMAK